MTDAHKDATESESDAKGEAEVAKPSEAKRDASSEGRDAADSSVSSAQAGDDKQAEQVTPVRRKKTGAAAVAARIVESSGTSKVSQLAKDMFDGKPTAATQAARVLSEIANTKPELLVGTVEKMVEALRSDNRRVVQTGADALPAIAKIAPAKVAKHMDALRDAYSETSSVGKDGLVQTFSNLCIASVAYQKRLEPVLCDAMADAEPKVLSGWVETVLPALKGEPHANVRAVVEKRLYAIPKRHAQKIADFLGLKLRIRR